jgi:hypothetical protein
MTKQKFGIKLSGHDRLAELCCAEKTLAAKNRKSKKVRLFKD